MAKRENQGLHIALISFVILSVLLIVTTYYFWSRSRHLMSEVENEKKQKTELNSQMRQAVDESTELKRFIGFPPETGIEAITEDFSNQMITYGGSLAEVDRNYKDLPKHLMSTIQQRHQRISELSAEIRTLTAEFKRRESELQTALDEKDTRTGEERKRSRHDRPNREDSAQQPDVANESAFRTIRQTA